MFENLRTIWQLRRGVTFSAYRALRKKLLVGQKVYSDVECLRKRNLRTFLEESSDTLPGSILPGTTTQNICNTISSKKLYPYSIFCAYDDHYRPYQVWRHDHRSHSNTLLLEEYKQDCSLDVAMTRDGHYVTINSNSHTSSEVHLLNCSTAEGDLVRVKDRHPHCSYHLEHAHNQFYILCSDSLFSDYKLHVADDSAPSLWKPHPLTAELPGLVIHDLEVCAKYLILYCTRNTEPVAVVINCGSDHKPYLIGESDRDCCWMEKPPAPVGFDADLFPVSFSSPGRLPHTYLTDGKSHWPVGGVKDVSLSCTVNRTNAKLDKVQGAGEEEIPITLCHHGNSPSSDKPLLVHVYGCYGDCVPMGYRPVHDLLLSLGWTLAFCHVRGGGEKGRGWYHAGQGENKMNSIQDVHACVSHLHSLGLSRPSLTVVTGRSAGGLVAAMFAHLWPHLLQASVLHVTVQWVPFVNVVRALSARPPPHGGGGGLLINDLDQGEFGGGCTSSAIDNKDHFLRSICPFSNLTPQDYPSAYITASRKDRLVAFDDVQEYAEKLSVCARSGSREGSNEKQGPVPHACTSARLPRGTVLFHELKGQDHFLSDDLEIRATTDALEVLFLHQALGLPLKSKFL